MLAKDVLTEEWLADVLQDSLEMDWTTTDGARAIMRALENGLVTLPQSGGQVAAIMTNTTTDAAEARADEAREIAHAADFIAETLRLILLSKKLAAPLNSRVVMSGHHLAYLRATAEAASGAGEREKWAFTPDIREAQAIAQLSEEQELSPQAVMRQALRLYQANFLRRKAGETVTWSGDEQRARDFAGPLASLPPATDPAIPDGWKLVPVEPTHEMIQAAAGSEAIDDEGIFPSLNDLIDYSGENKTRTVICAALSAALAAAPTIPATGEAVPEGMKPWAGGDAAPADIGEAAEVLHADGTKGLANKRSILWGRPVRKPGASTDWERLGPRLESRWIVAYVPATGHAATEGEGA